MVIEFIIEDLDTPLNHDAFKDMLNAFIFGMPGAYLESDELGIEINRQILRYIVKGLGKDHVDQIDKKTGQTPLILACDFLTDPIVIEILVEGGCHVNAVDCNDLMPLKIMKERLRKDPDNYDLQDIYSFLQRKGARKTWRAKNNFVKNEINLR